MTRRIRITKPSAGRTPWLLAAMTAAIAWNSHVHAAEPIRPKCSERVSDLAGMLGVSSAQHGPTGEFSAESHGGQVRIGCAKTAEWPTIRLTYPSEYPPAPFYDLVATITSQVAKQTPERMRLRAHRCHSAAKRASSGRSNRTLHEFR